MPCYKRRSALVQHAYSFLLGFHSQDRLYSFRLALHPSYRARIALSLVDDPVHACSEGFIITVAKAHIENRSAMSVSIDKVCFTRAACNVVAVELPVPGCD